MEPTLEDERLLEDTLRRSSARLTKRELVMGVVMNLGFAAGVAGMWRLAPPDGFAVVPAIACLAVLVIAMRVRFDTPLGYTTPIQLAFVPLVFTLPAPIVPIAVALAYLLAVIPEIAGRRVRASRLLFAAVNSSFALGPAAVLSIAHVPAWQAGPLVLLAALGAQFAVDCGVSTVRFAVSSDADLAAQLRQTWVYSVDAALSPAALVTAAAVHRNALAALALVPLIGLLAVFARERHKRLESTLELSNAYRGTALVLGDVVEADDGYTGEHCKSVVGLALDVAARLRLDATRRRNLEFAALLHDVGKIAIPKAIINKPGKLDPHEWEVIKTHTIEGQKMLDRVGGFMREVGLIVRAHHERWDGGGYPDGLTGEQIPLEARIVSCCDTWNAMRTDRPYRAALAHKLAAAEMRSVSGTQLDPAVVEGLLSIVAPDAPAEPTPETRPERQAHLRALLPGIVQVQGSE